MRNSPRQRVFQGARVVLAHLGSTLDGTIIDLSATGARLAFGQRIDLAKGSELELKFLKTGRHVRARVAWATETQCGVAFTGSAAAIALAIDGSVELKRRAA